MTSDTSWPHVIAEPVDDEAEEEDEDVGEMGEKDDESDDESGDESVDVEDHWFEEVPELTAGLPPPLRSQGLPPPPRAPVTHASALASLVPYGGLPPPPPKPTPAYAPGGSGSSSSSVPISTRILYPWHHGPPKSPPLRSQGTLHSAFALTLAVRKARGQMEAGKLAHQEEVSRRREMGQQWRFTWMGAPDADEGKDRIEKNLFHNGGVVAASTICAPELGSAVWGTAVQCRLKLPILLFGCESLVDRFDEVVTKQWSALDDTDTPTVCCLVAVTVHMHPPSEIVELGDSIRIMIISATYVAEAHQRTRLPPTYDDRQKKIFSTTVAEFLAQDLTNLPRVILGDLGSMAPHFIQIATAALGHHVCWAGNGPTKPGWLDTSGFWLVGSHAHVAGKGVMERSHAVEDQRSLRLPAVRVTSADTSLHGTVCTSGEPTCYIGKSHRMRISSKRRRVAAVPLPIVVPAPPAGNYNV
jgi:hypothetical protein